MEQACLSETGYDLNFTMFLSHIQTAQKHSAGNDDERTPEYGFFKRWNKGSGG